MIRIENGSPAWHHLVWSMQVSTDTARDVSLSIHEGAGTVSIKVGEGMWTPPLDARVFTLCPKCRTAFAGSIVTDHPCVEVATNATPTGPCV